MLNNENHIVKAAEIKNSAHAGISLCQNTMEDGVCVFFNREFLEKQENN